MVRSNAEGNVGFLSDNRCGMIQHLGNMGCSLNKRTPSVRWRAGG